MGDWYRMTRGIAGDDDDDLPDCGSAHHADYKGYEAAKAALQALCLPTEEYERRLKAIATRYHV